MVVYVKKIYFDFSNNFKSKAFCSFLHLFAIIAEMYAAEHLYKNEANHKNQNITEKWQCRPKA